MFFNITLNNNKTLINYYNKIMNELNSFFNIEWVNNKPKVFLVDNKDTLNLLSKSPEWVVGWTFKNNVYILHPRNFSEEYFISLLKHELTHTFFNVISKNHTNPAWLYEGVSLYLSGQYKDRKVELFKSFLDNKNIYLESGLAVKLLINYFGKEKLLQLIKQLGSRQFNNLFKEIYGFNPSYEEFNKLLKNILN